MTVAVRNVLPNELAFVWTHYVPFVLKFLNRAQGESNLESVLQNLMSYEFQCWVVEEDETDTILAVCITKIDVLAEYTALHILGLGSLNHSWVFYKDLHKELEIFAKDHNCSRISTCARKGWKKMFKKAEFTGSRGDTYEHVYDILHMKLT